MTTAHAKPAATTVAKNPAKTDGGVDFYRGIYERLYRLGYHRDTDYSHAKDLCALLLDRYQFESILDVGCSHGWSVGFFQKRGRRAAGVDVSATAVERGRGLGRDLRVASAAALPFRDGEFDVVMSTDCFEHLRPEDVDAAVGEALRVARRYVALKICPRGDRNNWWKLLAGGRRLHMCVRPLEWWKTRFTAGGARLIHDDGETFILEKASTH